MNKEKATLKMIIDWLDCNIDENANLQNELYFDSYELKEKIGLALDKKTTIKQIEENNL